MYDVIGKKQKNAEIRSLSGFNNYQRQQPRQSRRSDRRSVDRARGLGYTPGEVSAMLSSSPFLGRELDMPESLSVRIQDGFGINTNELSLRESPAVAIMGARATAQGNVISFAPGEYQPNTADGLKVLGHELNHVREQAEGNIHANVEGTNIHYDPVRETSCDSMGDAFASGSLSGASPVSVASADGAAVQGSFRRRSEDDEPNSGIGGILGGALKGAMVGGSLGGPMGALLGAKIGGAAGAIRQRGDSSEDAPAPINLTASEDGFKVGALSYIESTYPGAEVTRCDESGAYLVNYNGQQFVLSDGIGTRQGEDNRLYVNNASIINGLGVGSLPSTVYENENGVSIRANFNFSGIYGNEMAVGDGITYGDAFMQGVTNHWSISSEDDRLGDRQVTVNVGTHENGIPVDIRDNLETSHHTITGADGALNNHARDWSPSHQGSIVQTRGDSRVPANHPPGVPHTPIVYTQEQFEWSLPMNLVMQWELTMHHQLMVSIA